MRKYIATILAAISSCMTAVAALPARPWASDTIAPIDTLRLTNITAEFGGNSSTTAGPNFGMMIFNSVALYSNYMGVSAYVVLFAIPFLMMWIVQADMTMAAFIGMLFSLYVFTRLPEQYILFSVGCFVISITALIWSLYRRGY